MVNHQKKNKKEAEKYIKLIFPETDVEEYVAKILSTKEKSNTRETIFMKRHRFPMILAFLIAFFNQFSGINAFLYYAPRIFEEAGLGESTALLSSIGIGVVNMIFTLIGLSLIDKLGRKQLMYMGSLGYIISLSLVSIAFYFGWSGMAVAMFLFIFIAAHAIGQGTVIWVFISEIFPTHLRANGQAFGSSTHWVLAAIIPSLVPLLFSSIGGSMVFAIFAFMMILQLIFVWRVMPETKGKTLEEINAQMIR